MKKAIFCLNLKGRTQKLMNWVPILASAGQEPLGAEHASLLFAKHVFSVGLFALAERLAPDRRAFAIVAIEKLTPTGGSWSAETLLRFLGPAFVVLLDPDATGLLALSLILGV
jgi:hypothetical protein